MTRKSVTIVGKGNVGSHLANAFISAGCEVDSINSRTLTGLNKDTPLIILTVSDSAIFEVAEKIKTLLNDYKGIVVHSSGSLPLCLLSDLFENYGVFYPLQTFSKDIEILNFDHIPVFLEGNSENVLSALHAYARLITKNVYDFTTERREKLHLASVFACNFVNAMLIIAQDILQESHIPSDVLNALIEQTFYKVRTHPSIECQTGPAVRGDKIIMQKHKDMLINRPDESEIYQLVSEYIYKKFH